MKYPRVSNLEKKLSKKIIKYFFRINPLKIILDLQIKNGKTNISILLNHLEKNY